VRWENRWAQGAKQGLDRAIFCCISLVQKVFYIEIDTGEELNASVGVNRKKSKDSTSAIKLSNGFLMVLIR